MIFNFNPVCFSGGQREAPGTLEVWVVKGVPALWSGGPRPSHPSPLQAHAKEPQHPFSIYLPCNELLLPTSCASNMSRGEEKSWCWGHQPQMDTTSVEAHPQHTGWTALILQILCLQRAWQKGPLCICSSLYRYAIQARVAPYKDHISCIIDEKLSFFGKWSNSSEQRRIQFMLKNP